MRGPRRTYLLLTATTCALLAVSTGTAAAQRVAIPRNGTIQAAPNRDAYDRGYREGVQRGEHDGRDGRDFGYDRDDLYRSGDRGYNRSWGNRDTYRSEFRQGFAAGYRSGYERNRATIRDGRDNNRNRPRVPRGYQEPASARGYSDGYERGLDDGHDRDRYDPVRHGDYRKGDEGYYREYGSKDAYKNNYRAGFRQGYEDGYRQGGRR
jgi:hypothetical protein